MEKRHDGLSAADYLRNCHGYSRRMLTRLKQGCGSLAVNGIAIGRLTEKLSEGDCLEIFLDVEEQVFEPNYQLSVSVAYEDEDVVVFNKPAGMPVHPSHRHRDDTLANVFAARCLKKGEKAGFHAINRLDRDTSGLCVVAKHPYAADRLSGEVDKTYYAVIEGIPDFSCGTLSFPIARAGESIILRRVDPAGKHAVTHYRMLKSGNGHSLLEIQLETGRTHQIRVHFSYIGHPLAGDDLYGGQTTYISRQALHCGKVRFFQPVTGRKLTVCAPLPEEMEQVLHS